MRHLPGHGLCGCVGFAALAVAMMVASPLSAQNLPPSRLQGPPVDATDDMMARDTLLRRELFRRRAAEAAQKELEQIAEQLRLALAREITARRKAEENAAALASRESLSDEIDRERQRLRERRAKAERARRAELEREIETLRQRLRVADAANAKLRKKLERNGAGAKTARAGQVDGGEREADRIRTLEKRLAAAEWAKKVAEAQLELVRRTRVEKSGDKP